LFKAIFRQKGEDIILASLNPIRWDLELRSAYNNLYVNVSQFYLPIRLQEIRLPLLDAETIGVSVFVFVMFVILEVSAVGQPFLLGGS
jgi:hypothetical protein